MVGERERERERDRETDRDRQDREIDRESVPVFPQLLQGSLVDSQFSSDNLRAAALHEILSHPWTWRWTSAPYTHLQCSTCSCMPLIRVHEMHGRVGPN